MYIYCHSYLPYLSLLALLRVSYKKPKLMLPVSQCYILRIKRRVAAEFMYLPKRKCENPIETALHLEQILPVQLFQLKAPLPLTIASVSLCTRGDEGSPKWQLTAELHTITCCQA